MKCIYGTGEAAMTLTGTPWQEDCGEVKWAGGQTVQREDLVRSVTPWVEGLDNRSDTLPIPIVLQIGDPIAALRYISEILWLLPKSGALVFIEQVQSTQLTITYNKAVFQTVERRRDGENAVLVYTFIVTGPPTFETVSDAPLALGTEGAAVITTED